MSPRENAQNIILKIPITKRGKSVPRYNMHNNKVKIIKIHTPNNNLKEISTIKEKSITHNKKLKPMAVDT